MPPTKNALASGCLALFGLPFAAAGLFVLWMMVVAPQPKPLPVRLAGIGAGLLFAGIGFGLMVGSIYGKKKADALDQLKASYPIQPWKWRSDWDSGVARSRETSSSFGKWIVAAIWNTITFSGVTLAGPDLVRKQDLRGLFFLPFLAVGVWMVVDAVRQTIRRAEFGTGIFDLGSVPFRLGGPLNGTLHARFRDLPANGVHVRLTCVRRTVSGSGNSRSTSEKILWRDESDVPAARIAQGPEGSLIPVSLRIPPDLFETNMENMNDCVYWLLQATAAVPGVDYEDSFEVPVYGRVEIAATPSDSPDATAASIPQSVAEPERHTVLLQPAADGAEFYFSADRNPGAALGITVFFLMFGGITVFLISTHVTFVFPLFFGFFSLILFLIALFTWLGTSKVKFGADRVSVHSGLLGVGPTRTIPFSDIAALEYAIGMQSGGAEGTPYYDLRLRTKSGRTYTLGSGVKDKKELEWLLAQMRKAAGLK